MIDNNDIEFQSPETIKLFQEDLLRKAVSYLAGHSPFYQRMFRERNIDFLSIQGLEDLKRLPFTEKKDLQLYNDDFLCCPKADVVDYVTTSGTLGDPVTFCCTEKDLQRLAFNEMKSFACAGLHKGNILQLMTTIDKRFMAGLAYFMGIRKLGASVIRVGNGIPELQWDTIQRLKPDAVMCVPSFILRLIEYAEQHNINYHQSSIRRIIGVGEGLRTQDFSYNLLGQRIHEKWQEVQLFATYSSTEMGATFSECEYGLGGHVHPELIIVEIIGDDGLEVEDGKVGEIVVTTLGVEGMPLLRFRTGDLAAKRVERCRCGRWSYRLTPLVGRKNNMIKLKGTSLYPPAINDVLANIPYITNYYVVVRDSAAGTDEVEVVVAVDDKQISFAKVQYSDISASSQRAIIKDLQDHFRAHLRVTPLVRVEQADEVMSVTNPQKSRKPIRFIDLRHHE